MCIFRTIGNSGNALLLRRKIILNLMSLNLRRLKGVIYKCSVLCIYYWISWCCWKDRLCYHERQHKILNEKYTWVDVICKITKLFVIIWKKLNISRIWTMCSFITVVRLGFDIRREPENVHFFLHIYFIQVVIMNTYYSKTLKQYKQLSTCSCTHESLKV